MRRFLMLGLTLVGMRSIAAERNEYHIVCDVGSSGTRLHVFRLAGARPWVLKANDVHGFISHLFVEKIEPGLSAYADDPVAAVTPFLAMFSKAAEQVPLEHRRQTPTLIYGTAGMRALPEEKQERLWRALRDGLLGAPAFPFDRGSVELQTVNGYKEGLWAMYAANILSGRASWESRALTRPRLGGISSNLAGILDMGGASTQVALPSGQTDVQVADAVADVSERVSDAFPGMAWTSAVLSSVQPVRRVGRSDRPVVESYQGFGANVMRDQLLATMPSAMAACYQRGSKHASGPGNATVCRAVIKKIIREHILDCQEQRSPSPAVDEDAYCPRKLTRKANSRVNSSRPELFALTGYFYAADFLRWWLTWNTALVNASPLVAGFTKNYPSPTLAEYTAGVDALCNSDLNVIGARLADPEQAHTFTTSSKAQHRCYQANYGLVFMGDVLGIPRSSRLVTFAHEMHGQVLEWPVGAVLERRTQKKDVRVMSQEPERLSTRAVADKTATAASLGFLAAAVAVGSRRRLGRGRLF